MTLTSKSFDSVNNFFILDVSAESRHQKESLELNLST